ncbi:carph-isopro domain-containing protein [Rubritepida flocculans]|uniref:carph-isopro domain-containing protein n=1 Tax=Rubritepida flocculans TaxID=182403 RepID=UPI0012EC93D7|nr:hypothetical protein [Rubritepida flocculans]
MTRETILVADMLRQLGGPTRVARACGVTISAVGSWQVRNEIPARHWLTLWRMARAAGLAWRPPGAEGLELIERAPASQPEAAA